MHGSMTRTGHNVAHPHCFQAFVQNIFVAVERIRARVSAASARDFGIFNLTLNSLLPLEYIRSLNV